MYRKGACFSGSDENCKGLNQAWDNWDGGGRLTWEILRTKQGRDEGDS